MSNKSNVEIKAMCNEPQIILNKLLEMGADNKGIDHQIDTYFQTPNGRLKLRQGNIENSLIFYERNNQAGPKTSDISLVHLSALGKDVQALKETLSRAYGVFKVVDKKRNILFINHVKFHIDEVLGLGSFMEIEVIDETCKRTIDELEKECSHFMKELNIKNDDLLEVSYSDMLENS